MLQSKVLLALLAVSISDVPLMPIEYSLLCEGEQATGFNWVNGQWVKTNYKPDRYLIIQSLENECYFGVRPDRTLKGESILFSREVCLNIREVGKEFRPKQSEKCTEFYVEADGKWRRQFSCDGFIHNIEGNFEGSFRRIAGSNLHDDVPKKDSMVLEVGRCSRIN